MMTSELLIWKHEIPKRNILGSKVFWYFLGRLLRNYPQGIFYLMYSYIFLKRMSLAAALIGTQNLKDSPESGSGKIQNNKQLRQLLLCVSWDWGWSCREVMHCAGLGSMWEGDCRVMRMMEYHTQKNAPDLLPLFVFFFLFSPPACRMSAEHSSLLFVFATRRLEASHTRFCSLGKALKSRPKLKRAGGAWIQRCYMLKCLLVQQEMSNNNKLGKVKAK